MGFLAMQASSFMIMKLLKSIRNFKVLLLSPSSAVEGIPSNLPFSEGFSSTSRLLRVKGSSPVPLGFCVPSWVNEDSGSIRVMKGISFSFFLCDVDALDGGLMVGIGSPDCSRLVILMLSQGQLTRCRDA